MIFLSISFQPAAIAAGDQNARAFGNSATFIKNVRHTSNELRSVSLCRREIHKTGDAGNRCELMMTQSKARSVEGRLSGRAVYQGEPTGGRLLTTGKVGFRSLIRIILLQRVVRCEFAIRNMRSRPHPNHYVQS